MFFFIFRYVNAFYKPDVEEMMTVYSFANLYQDGEGNSGYVDMCKNAWFLSHQEAWVAAEQSLVPFHLLPEYQLVLIEKKIAKPDDLSLFCMMLIRSLQADFQALKKEKCDLCSLNTFGGAEQNDVPDNYMCSFCESIDDVVDEHFNEVLEDNFQFAELYAMVRNNYRMFSFQFLGTEALNFLTDNFVYQPEFARNREMLKAFCKIPSVVPIEYRHIFDTQKRDCVM